VRYFHTKKPAIKLIAGFKGQSIIGTQKLCAYIEPLSFGQRQLLATQTQTLDQIAVTTLVFFLQVIQQLTTLVYHANQTTT